MAYEIPQQLQYEEKIIFGLTFKQLAYASVFVIPSLIIFFRSKLDIYIRVSIISVLISMACLFMFFNMSGYLKNIMTWIKFREVTMMDAKMIQFIGIEKIDNGVIYVSKNKKLPSAKKQ